MAIIGWIRLGDKAACGATVVEACGMIQSHGAPLSYQGAKLNCGCVIVESHPSFCLPNGSNVPHHGHLTSGRCPLVSTLNGIHGWESPRPVAIEFIKHEEGWGPASKGLPPEHHNADQHLIFEDQDGNSLEGVLYHLNTPQGTTIKGQTDSSGKTQKVTGNLGESLNWSITGDGENYE